MPMRILLVEDMRDVHGVVLDLLNMVGEFVLAAAVTTEAEALLWLDEHPGAWDLAIVDLVLDQGSGLGVLVRAKKSLGVRVVVFSDFVTPGIRARCTSAGADAVFQKGTEVSAFVDWCSRLWRDEGGASGPPARRR